MNTGKIFEMLFYIDGYSQEVDHNFMAAADSAVVLLELDVQWDYAATHS